MKCFTAFLTCSPSYSNSAATRSAWSWIVMTLNCRYHGRVPEQNIRISNAGLLYDMKGRTFQHGIENPWQLKVASVRLQKAGQLLESSYHIVYFDTEGVDGRVSRWPVDPLVFFGKAGTTTPTSPTHNKHVPGHLPHNHPHFNLRVPHTST